MTPTSPDNQPGFELPQPVNNEDVPALPPAEASPLHAEQQSKQAELPGSSLPPLPAQSAASTAAPANAAYQMMGADQAAATVTPGATAPPVADDVDLIEKEWVDKAKAIVNRTREDPHQQNKQLNEFKADYMKKRYGKDIRLTDE